MIPVPPKRGRRRHEGSGDAYPCVVCGTPIPTPEYEVRLVDGGASLALPDEVVDARGDMGLYPIGPECRRRIPAAYVIQNGGTR